MEGVVVGFGLVVGADEEICCVPIEEDGAFMGEPKAPAASVLGLPLSSEGFLRVVGEDVGASKEC